MDILLSETKSHQWHLSDHNVFKLMKAWNHCDVFFCGFFPKDMFLFYILNQQDWFVTCFFSICRHEFFKGYSPDSGYEQRHDIRLSQWSSSLPYPEPHPHAQKSDFFTVSFIHLINNLKSFSYEVPFFRSLKGRFILFLIWYVFKKKLMHFLYGRKLLS